MILLFIYIFLTVITLKSTKYVEDNESLLGIVHVNDDLSLDDVGSE